MRSHLDTTGSIIPRTLWVLMLGLAFLIEASYARSPQSTSTTYRGSTSKRQSTIAQRSEADRDPPSLDRINSRSDFDRLARVYYQGRLLALPHVMFVIDRRANRRVYYVNSRSYQFHKDFVNATYLSLARWRAFYDNNYLKSDRRFILGTIAYQTIADKFTFE